MEEDKVVKSKEFRRDNYIKEREYRRRLSLIGEKKEKKKKLN